MILLNQGAGFLVRAVRRQRGDVLVRDGTEMVIVVSARTVRQRERDLV